MEILILNNCSLNMLFEGFWNNDKRKIILKMKSDNGIYYNK